MLNAAATTDTLRRFNITAVWAIIITAVAIVLANIVLPNDTFYTIKVGETIVNQGMSGIDNLSFHKDIPYTYPHWLYDVVIYLIYQIGGFIGLSVLTFALAVALGLTLYFSYLKLNYNPFVALLFTVIILYMFSNGALVPRAQSVTYILFVAELLCLEFFLRQGNKLYLAGLFLIAVLIANLHAAVWPFFFILFLPFIGEYIIARLIKLPAGAQGNTNGTIYQKLVVVRNDRAIWLIGAMLVCITSGLLTAIGDTPYTYLIKTYRGISVEFIMEHQPLAPISDVNFLIFIACSLALLIFTPVKIRLNEFFLFGGMLLLSLMSSRQTMLFYILSSYLVCRMASEFFVHNNLERVNQYIAAIGKRKGSLTTLAFIALLMLPKVGVNGYSFIGEDYPVEATDYLLKNTDVSQIRPYVDYGFGSYLIFKDIKVFIDSRADLYTLPFNQKQEIFGDNVSLTYFFEYYDDIFAKYCITHPILQHKEPLNVLISRDAGYKRLYSDDKFVVYERSASLNGLCQPAD